MLTQDDNLLAADEPVPALERRRAWWGIVLAALGFVPLLAVLVASILPSTAFVTKNDCTARAESGACTEFGPDEDVRYALTPADAEPVEPRLTVVGPQRYRGSGQMLFVTVTSPELRLLDWFVGRSNPAVDLKSYDDLYPGNDTPQQQRVRGAQSMRTAKETAEYVALKRLGYPVELVPGDVVVEQLVCLEANAAQTECVRYAPSDELLDPGDKLLEVDGVGVTTVDDLTPILQRHKPGDRISVVYERNGNPGDGEVEVIASPDDPKRTIIGFFPSDTTRIEVPDDITITIDTDRIGGPSAGLAFTLTLLDELSAGDLFGGRKVAATGTININGEVGAIGGLPSKASAVLQAGAKYFLVPTSQGEADIARARKVVGDQVEIIPVATVDEALAALARIGGDPFVPPIGA
jgi:PDZ domain-containing protein